MAITGVDFVSVPTRDLAAARRFYGEVLGLEAGPLWRDADPLGAEFETGTVTLALIDCERLGIPFSPSAVPVALHVDDVEAERARLAGAGVEVVGEVIDSGVCRMASFRDPDGNALLLHCRYAPRGGA